MAYGFVYILNNHQMPNLYKIGFTNKSPMQRCHELSSKTSVPEPYNLVCYSELSYPAQLEHKLHNDYKDNRVNSNREFFKLSYIELYDIHNLMKEVSDNFTCCQELDIIINVYLARGDEYGMV